MKVVSLMILRMYLNPFQLLRYHRRRLVPPAASAADIPPGVEGQHSKARYRGLSNTVFLGLRSRESQQFASREVVLRERRQIETSDDVEGSWI
jgi:hypothetical protein